MKLIFASMAFLISTQSYASVYGCFRNYSTDSFELEDLNGSELEQGNTVTLTFSLFTKSGNPIGLVQTRATVVSDSEGPYSRTIGFSQLSNPRLADMTLTFRSGLSGSINSILVDGKPYYGECIFGQ